MTEVSTRDQESESREVGGRLNFWVLQRKRSCWPDSHCQGFISFLFHHDPAIKRKFVKPIHAMIAQTR